MMKNSNFYDMNICYIEGKFLTELQIQPNFVNWLTMISYVLFIKWH